jgi:hypothetical protein
MTYKPDVNTEVKSNLCLDNLKMVKDSEVPVIAAS